MGSPEDELKDGRTTAEESGRWIAETMGSRDRGEEINESVKCER